MTLMIALIIALWFPLKKLVVWKTDVNVGLGFYLYPGMNPHPFAKCMPGLEFKNILWFGLIRCVLGLCLFFMARNLFPFYHWTATALSLISFSLIIHFGLFDILTAWWRWRGVDVRVIFDAPWKSKSLSEFWGRRWNRAFSEMSKILVYDKYGLTGVFIFSGLLHEIAISVPVGIGFGGPILYFLIHGLLVYREKTFNEQYSLIWIFIFLPLLFHPWFLRGVVWPIL